MIVKTLRIASLFMYVMLISAFWSGVVFAQGWSGSRVPARAPSSPVRSENAEGHVTILILDMSTSMYDNDPLQLRCSAAKAYIDLSSTGDKIAVIGLTNFDGSSASRQSPFLRAEVWQRPTPMDVLSQRTALKRVIMQRPTGTPSCQYPYGATPLYDALNQAQSMLTQTARVSGKAGSGSVLLMTDGASYPDEQNQDNAIRSTLLPIFLKHQWPIDVVALKPSDQAHQFLERVTGSTGGQFYQQGRQDDEPPPLSITSFFTTIFAQRQHRTLTTRVPPQMLEGASQSIDFQLDSYGRHLDVIVVKDQDIRARITTPGGNILPTSDPPPGAFVINDDPYYEIFSFDGPRAGVWQLDIEGSGYFEVKSLVTSWLQISLLLPDPNTGIQAIDRPLTIAAQLVDGRNPAEPISGSRFVLTAIICHTGMPQAGAKAFMRRVSLRYENNDHLYRYSMMLPSDASPGAYSITISASEDTDAIISSIVRPLRLVHFPTLWLIAPQTGRPVARVLQLTSIHWDPWLQRLYSPNAVWGDWPGQIALSQPINSHVLLNGQVHVDPDSQMQVAAIHALLRSSDGMTRSVAVHITGKNIFQLILPSLSDGQYALALTTQGNFEDRSGDLGTTVYTVYVTGMAAPTTLHQRAWAITAVFALILLLPLLAVLILHWHLTGPSPFGECMLYKDQKLYHYPFNRRQHTFFSLLLRRNKLYSEEVKAVPSAAHWSHLPSGLIFRFYRNHTIKVSYRRGKQGSSWQRSVDGTLKPLKAGFSEEKELMYGQGDQANPPVVKFTVDPR
jgi:hypothetical protein